jgi:hypothetical protein
MCHGHGHAWDLVIIARRDRRGVTEKRRLVTVHDFPKAVS